jgi:CheY-like chemotaxis protein
MSAARPRHPVLIIEDNEEIRDLLEILLDNDGYRVATAGNGQLALDALHDGLQPCLILLDYHMPVMDGRAFREAQLSAHLVDHVPVLLCSADSSIRTEGLRVDAIMEKPFNYDDLLRVVREHCQMLPRF